MRLRRKQLQGRHLSSVTYICQLPTFACLRTRFGTRRRQVGREVKTRLFALGNGEDLFDQAQIAQHPVTVGHCLRRDGDVLQQAAHCFQPFRRIEPFHVFQRKLLGIEALDRM